MVASAVDGHVESTTASGPEDLPRALRAATLYHVDGLTQASVPLEDIGRCPGMVPLAGGTAKYPAALGALRVGFARLLSAMSLVRVGF
jgi:DNA-binding transcriptional regulator LsrR (DeoR family)